MFGLLFASKILIISGNNLQQSQLLIYYNKITPYEITL